MKRSHWVGLLAVGAAAVLVAIYVGRLGTGGDRGGPAIPDQRADDGSSGLVDESLQLFDASVDRAARLTEAERVDEGATALDRPLDVLERVLMVLVFRGQLTVETSAHPPIRWPEARFAVKPVSPYAVWIDLRLSAEFQESGAFELRGECRRMPESAHSDDGIGYWTHVALTVSHPLLEQATVEVPVAPWPEGLVAGPETQREIEVGTIGLGLASGVQGRVVATDGGPAGGAVAAFCPLDAEDRESSVQTFMVCDAGGHFFLHSAPGTTGFVFATAPGMAPDWRRVEIGEETVTDLGVLRLGEGYRIAGKVQGSETWSTAGHPMHVEVDGFEHLETSQDVACDEFVLPPTRERFCWNSSEGVFRHLCQVEVGPDGSFEIGGLSQRCHRLRVQSPRVGWQPHLNDRIVSSRNDVWTLKCAPATGVVLSPATSLIHFRIVPTSRWPLMGLVTWVDEGGNVQSTRVQLDGASLETMPHQSVELQLEGDPAGRTHRLVAPAAGEVATNEFEVLWLPP